MALTVILIAVLLGAGYLGYRSWSKRRAVRRLLGTPLTEEQRAILARHVPLARKLPPELRGQYEGKVQLFLQQIEFIGCAGLEVTEEMRLSIAAQACLLVANTNAWYKTLRTILIYPTAFKSRRSEHDGFVVTERETVRLGESWSRGPVILSWEHAEQGALVESDGHNVVFHEFAHQIDDLSRQPENAALLDTGQDFADWQRVFEEAFLRHGRNVRAGHRAVMDAYGAESPTEFFAVAVEVFFERPAELYQAEPEVYRHLSELFRLDPKDWT